jgi:hypothetical protein
MSYVKYEGQFLPTLVKKPYSSRRFFDYLFCNDCDSKTKHFRNNEYLMECEDCKSENYIDQSRDHYIGFKLREVKKILKEFYHNITKVTTEGGSFRITYHLKEIEYTLKHIAEQKFQAKEVRISITKSVLFSQKEFKTLSNKLFLLRSSKMRGNILPKLLFHENIHKCKGYKDFESKYRSTLFDYIEKINIYQEEVFKQAEFDFEKITIRKNGIKFHFEEKLNIKINQTLSSHEKFRYKDKIYGITTPFYDKYYSISYKFLKRERK